MLLEKTFILQRFWMDTILVFKLRLCEEGNFKWVDFPSDGIALGRV